MILHETGFLSYCGRFSYKLPSKIMEPISEFKFKITLNFKFNGVVLDGKNVNLNELK